MPMLHPTPLPCLMMKIEHLISLFVALLLCPYCSFAQDSEAITTLRPVHASYTASIGTGHIADTYLSPLRYSGLSLSLDYERHQAMRFDPEHWTMRLAASIEGMHTKSPSGNSTMWEGMLHVSWGMMHRWHLPAGITVAGGGSTGVNLGCLYSERNSNNPASAKASWTINLTGYAIWKHTFGKLPITFAWQPVIPVAGLFFAPEYGQLYYEIYLGERSGLAHFGWWGNYFAMENLVTADLHLGESTALRLGFRSNLLSTSVHDITTRIYNTSFVIGVSGEWLSYSPSKKLSDKTRIITAF